MENVIEMTVLTIFANPTGRYSHLLLEAPPGMGKTVLCTTIAKWCGLDEGRIQLTPDMQPGEIVMNMELDMDANGKQSTRKIFGPVFTNLLLADEINRTPPRTQSAILQPMAELSTTYSGVTYPLGFDFSEAVHRRLKDNPALKRNDILTELYAEKSGAWSRRQPGDTPLFYVFATQNPIENEGTYRLPEAQLDRFLFKVTMDYQPKETLVKILHDKNLVWQSVEVWMNSNPDDEKLKKILSRANSDEFRKAPPDQIREQYRADYTELETYLKDILGPIILKPSREDALRNAVIFQIRQRAKAYKNLATAAQLSPKKIIAIRNHIALRVRFRSDRYFDFVAQILDTIIKDDENFETKVSPRLCDTILSAAKAACVLRHAKIDYFDWERIEDTLFVSKDDILRVARYMLPHRVGLTYDAIARGETDVGLIETLLRRMRRDYQDLE
jgi:MoxR-like ATPase